MILDYPLTLAPRWEPIVVNSMKITPIKYLMCGASNNQATKIKCMEVINTSKSRKQREKERDNTRNLFTQFGLKLIQFGGESSPMFHYNDE